MQQEMKKKRFAGIRPPTSPMDSSHKQPQMDSSRSRSPKNRSYPQSVASSQYSDYDGGSTPIPSLHGNLVRNRYRRDPLE